MIDKLTEDISPPTIILGLGDFGDACLRKLEAGVYLSAVPRRLAAMRAVSGLGAVDIQTRGDLTEIKFPADVSGRAAVYNDFLANAPQVVEELKKEVEQLAGAGGAVEGSGRIKVFVVAKAEEVDGSALAVALPSLIRTHLDGFVANWPVSLAGFFLLPKGGGENGAQVFSFLNELSDGRPGYDQSFLITEANTGSLIGDEGAAEMISEFADLMSDIRFETAVAEIMDVSGAAAAGFGLTCVVHPVEHLVAGAAARFGCELVKEGILSGAGDSFYRTADEYLKAEGFEIGAMRDGLLVTEAGDIADQMTVGAVELRALPLALWADRIASYADFLGQERLPRLIGRMEANLNALSRRMSARLTAKIDGLMSEAAALDKATKFVDRLDERAADLRETARGRSKTDSVPMDDLSVFRDHLVDRVRHFPEAIALTGRAMLLAPVAYFFFRDFIKVLDGFPDIYLNPAYLPPPAPTGAAALAFTMAFLLLLYRRAEGGLAGAKDLYIRAIENKYQSALNRASWELLDRWLGEYWPDLIAGERKQLREVKKEYLRLAEALDQPASSSAKSSISRSITDIFGVTYELRYKRGRYDLPEEAGRFAARGHQEWRSAGPDDIKGFLNDFCRRGLSFADQRSVDKLLVELVAGEEQSAAFLDDLRRRSRPFAAMAADLPAVVEIAGVPGGRRSPLAWQTGLLKEATVVETAGLHRFAFTQLVCPIQAGDLAAFPRWRRAYETCPDPSQHECPGEAA